MNKFWLNVDGEKHPNHEAMLAYLLQQDVLFCNSRVYLEEDLKAQGKETIVLFINCNDVFGPGADAEELTLAEVPVLFELERDKDFHGIVEFVAKKRKLRPVSDIVAGMQQKGHWTPELEALPRSWKVYDPK